jgi:D-alanyl-lipoteichoic acid acyltransferase DltB (MBOAT superfamily)
MDLLSTVIDYSVGLALVAPRWASVRTTILVTSITVQLLLLGVFKYYNFFIASLSAALTAAGYSPSLPTLEIVLPVGISFYTFHTISYTVDLYTRRYTQPTRDFIAFALFVSYFPQLVAGPIARASHLLPQMLRPRTISAEKFWEGGYLFVWGLFKKVFVADNLAVLVDVHFRDTSDLNSGTALLAMYAFAGQIYCDFSGYSDMARGLAQFMGFELQMNFNLPYFSRTPSEFWTRWHISLSTLLRDYLYIPLGGNRHGTFNTYRNLMITMLLGGLWHGASWTFVAWGAYHGMLLVLYRPAEKSATNAASSPMGDALQRLVLFHLVCIGWVFFRATTFTDIVQFFAALASSPAVSVGDCLRLGVVAPLIAVEAFQWWRRDEFAILTLPWPVRGLFYVLLYVALLTYGRWVGDSFIYFQF